MKSLRSEFSVFVICFSVMLFGIMVTSFAKSNEYYSARTITLPDGKNIDKIVIKGPPTPPVGYERVPVKLPEPNLSEGINVLANVPAFDWSYGCSPTSAAMISGYYDRTGYSYMYTGPTNGGVMPMDNSAWGAGECPLSATHIGYDGRTIRGHVEDYWISYGDPGPDPFIIGGWPEHTYGECLADYMGSNQSTYGLGDGGTWFWNYTDGSPLHYWEMPGYGLADYSGMYGIYEFCDARGYAVDELYNQYILGWASPTNGFTYDQYKAEIDAGRPVMIHLRGHTVVGLGYDDSANLMYIHNTWWYGTETMTWGEPYYGLDHYGVTVVQLGSVDIYFDIKPQSWPNPLNTKSKGVLPVAILGTADFDVTTIDPVTVTLEGVAPIRWNIEDVATPDGELEDDCNATTAGADGYDDLTLKFAKQEIVAALGPVHDGDVIVLTVTGNLFYGTPIEGYDCVIIKSKGKKNNQSTSIDEISVASPKSYALYSNYPNPFNPTTTIRYALPEDSRVEVSIYNTLGQKVTTLVNDQQSAGEYRIQWQPLDLPSGVYIISFGAGDYHQIRKMLYVK